MILYAWFKSPITRYFEQSSLEPFLWIMDHHEDAEDECFGNVIAVTDAFQEEEKFCLLALVRTLSTPLRVFRLCQSLCGGCFILFTASVNYCALTCVRVKL